MFDMQAGINNKQDNVSYANLWLVAAAIINDSCFSGFSISKSVVFSVVVGPDISITIGLVYNREVFEFQLKCIWWYFVNFRNTNSINA